MAWGSSASRDAAARTSPPTVSPWLVARRSRVIDAEDNMVAAVDHAFAEGLKAVPARMTLSRMQRKLKLKT
jgi:hypothetical protein